MLNQNAKNAQGSATQREGIFRAGRGLVNSKQPHQRIESVCQCYCNAALSLRQIITGELRQVLLLNCHSDFVSFTIMQGEVVAN